MTTQIDLNDLTDQEYNTLQHLADQHSMTLDDTVQILITDLYNSMYQ